MSARSGITELIRRLMEEEAEDPELRELALEILEAYVRGGRRGVSELVNRVFEEVMRDANEPGDRGGRD